jgi:hypothetical protein
MIALEEERESDSVSLNTDAPSGPVSDFIEGHQLYLLEASRRVQ